MVLNLYLLDCMINGMLNAIYLIAAGGLLNVAGTRLPLLPTNHHDGNRGRAAEPSVPVPGAAASLDPRISQVEAIIDQDAGLDTPSERLAIRYQMAGREAKAAGRFAEAKAAWVHALDLRTELTTACPDHRILRERFCECANDLAWLLANAPDPAVRDPAHAVALADMAVQPNLDCAAYWNTLGAAHYRAGDFQATITALVRAVDLSDGGTAFDHLFLAMAHVRLGEQDQALEWFERARVWIEQNNPGHFELACLVDEARCVLQTTPRAAISGY